MKNQHFQFFELEILIDIYFKCGGKHFLQKNSTNL